MREKGEKAKGWFNGLMIYLVTMLELFHDRMAIDYSCKWITA